MEKEKILQEEYIIKLKKNGGVWDLFEKKPDENVQKKLEKYKKKGVWALFGKKFGENVPWICLQVAKTTNIADEIKKDINCLKPSIDEKIKENKKNYVNQFGNIMFEYNDYEYPSSREHLYNKIACEYNTLMFICVSEEANSAKRLDIEKYFAWRARALYWRNGGPYKKEKNYSEDDLNKIQEDTFMDIKLDEKIKKNLDSWFDLNNS